MTPADFADRAAALLGGRGWQTRFSAAMGIDPSTVRRWLAGDLPVPDYAAAAIELLEAVPKAFWPKRWLKPSS